MLKLFNTFADMADKKPLNIPTIFSLKELSKLSKVDYTQLYHANVGTYNSLTDNDRAKLFNTLHHEFEIAAAGLGFTVDGRRIQPK